MGYYRSDARKLAADIKAAIPDAIVEQWRDHSFAVDVTLGTKYLVACEPAIDWIERPETFLSLAEVKQKLSV